MSANSNFLGVEPLQFDEETDYDMSPSASPLNNRYRIRLSPMRTPVRKRRRKSGIILVSSATSDTEEPLMAKEPLSDISNILNLPTSTQSMPDLKNKKPRFDLDKSVHSDRFIPSRFEFDQNYHNSFTMMDKFDNSPLCVIRNKTKNRKPKTPSDDSDNDSQMHTPKGYKSDSDSNSNQKYDECLQNVLLPNHSGSNLHSYIIPNSENISNTTEYEHHLQECIHFNNSEFEEKNTNESNKNKCICKYILNERLNYNDSPRKVFKFNANPPINDSENNINISALPRAVNQILQNNKSNTSLSTNERQTNDTTNGITIPSKPLKTIALGTKHKRKSLLNDYYYHLMDFKPNHKFGVIAIKDDLHIIRGHLGDLDSAEPRKYISTLNRKHGIPRSGYHFSSVKLSPNNAPNSNIVCLGDNFGRLLFYDYVRGRYVSAIYKSNIARISVIDWKSNYNAYNGLIAVGSLDKCVRIYDNRTDGYSSKLKFHKGEVCGLRWNKNNEHLLLSGGNQNIVCCWDTRQNRKPLFTGQHKAAIRALAWYPYSDSMFISGGGSNDQCIKVWNINYKKERLSLLAGSQVCNLECLEYNKQNYLVSSHGFSSNSVIIWGMNHRINRNKNKNEIVLTRIKQLSGHTCRVLYLCKYSDCNIVSASAGPDQTLKYWKIFPNQVKSEFTHHMQSIIR